MTFRLKRRPLWADRSLADVGDVATARAVIGRPKGHIHGLTLSNNTTDATNDIDIALGIARDADDTYDLILSAGITKRLDAAWAVGSGEGGLDTGSIASTTYHVWLIGRSDTGVVDVLLSASASAPTMPANYDRKRRIGSILRESGAIVAFSQHGDEFLRLATAADVTATNPGTSAVTRTLSVPTGIVVHALIRVNTTNGASAVFPWTNISELVRTNEAPNGATADLALVAAVASVTSTQNGRMAVRTNASAQVRSRLSAGDANVVLSIGTFGWIDPRGRLA